MQEQPGRVVDLGVGEDDPRERRDAQARRSGSPGSSASCWRRSGEALIRNQGPSSARTAIDDCVRDAARPLPLRAAAQTRQLQFHWG